jgi:phosphoglycolate phosphatase
MEVYGVSKEEAEQLVKDFRERYVPIGVYESSPFPGIRELLEALRRAGKKVAVATSKPQTLAELLLERAGLRELFDVVVGSGGGVNNDAKWQIVTRAMELCGSKPENCVLVGDTRYDVEGAQKCGIPCIGVRWGYAAEGELEAAGAAAVAETMEALVSMLSAPGQKQ